MGISLVAVSILRWPLSMDLPPRQVRAPGRGYQQHPVGEVEALVVGPAGVMKGADGQATSLSQWSDRSRR